ncbi:MAG: glycosyltransferase family 4 protein [Methanoregula sp.]|jgi:glycosyltransferase involved in cell wall biosynthesis
MANYSENLINALMKRDVSVKIVTSHCVCKYKYCGSSSLFDGKYCLVTAPFDSFGDEPDRSMIQRLFYRTSRILLGLRYAKQCEDSDILHYQQSSSYSFGELPLLTLLTQTKVPFKVVTIHNLKDYRLGNPLRLLHRVYRYADAVIVHTEQQKNCMIQAGIPGDKIYVVFHGARHVDLRELTRTRVTFFGSPHKNKGFFDILKALRILRDEGIKINLEVYGIYGEDEEQTAKKEARRNNVEDQIQWYGSLSELEFDEKMQESMFTFANYTKPVWGSQNITRSMMNGTPVIATPIGGSSEYLGDTGMFVPPNDPSALAFAIRSLLENRELREDLGKMTRQRALQYLSWDAIAEKTIRIYQSVIDT